jgi:hypothetical protein
MNLVDILTKLRQRLMDDLEKDDREDLYLLFATFTILKETAWISRNKALIEVLVKFEDAAQDGTMGVKGIHTVPSLEAITTASPVQAE